MANFWDNDPVVSDGAPAAPQPVMSALPTSAAAVGNAAPWESDPIVGIGEVDEPAPSAEERYEAALEKVRLLEHPSVAPEKFRQAMTERQPTLIPGITNSGPMAPYDATQLAQHGMFFGLTDEATAGMDALGAGIGQLFSGGKGPSMGDVYSARQELEAARRDLGREQLGGWGTLAELVGGLGSGGTFAKGAMSVGGNAAPVIQALKGTAGATTSGGLYGFGSTDGGLGERLPGAGVGAVTGAVASAAAPLLARGAQRFIQGAKQGAMNRTAVAGAPVAANIKQAAKAGYKAAEATGAVVDGKALNLLSHDVRQMLASEGLLLPQTGKLLGGYPKAKSALQALEQYAGAGSLTVKQAQTLNRMFRKVAGSTDPQESRIGMLLINSLDDFFENLPPQAFSAGKGADAVRHWAKARTDYARFKRTEAIEQAIYRAKFNKGGFADGLRGEFASILKSNRKRRGFSPTELEAMERFVDGGALQDFLGHVSGGGSLTAGLAGHAVGGPIAGAAMAGGKLVAGKAASRALDRSARNVADLVQAEVALPGGIPKLPALPRLDNVASATAVRAGNPLLETPRGGLLELLSGVNQPIYVGGR